MSESKKPESVDVENVPEGHVAETPSEETLTPFKRWYAANRDEYRRARYQRYRTDPVYQQKVKEWNRTTRNRRREAREQEQQARAEARKVHLGENPVRATVREVVREDGTRETVELYSIGALARFLNRSVQVLRIWEQAGKLPKTPYFTDAGARLYSQAQMEVIRSVLEKRGILRPQGRRQLRRYRYAVYRVRLPSGAQEMRVFYRVGVVAAALGVSVGVLNRREAYGYFPETPFVGGQTKARLYLASQVQGLRARRAQVLDLVLDDVRRTALRSEIEAEWRAQGLYDVRMEEQCVLPKKAHAELLLGASLLGGDDAVEDGDGDDEDGTEGG